MTLRTDRATQMTSTQSGERDDGRCVQQVRAQIPIRAWVGSRFGAALPADRTAVLGVSASGELALALGIRHPDIYGAILCASPGAGYQPPVALPTSPLRAYFVAGTLEPFFHENAARWAAALREAGGDVVMNERVGDHGDAFWREEFPAMVEWAFNR